MCFEATFDKLKKSTGHDVFLPCHCRRIIDLKSGERLSSKMKLEEW
ncbi:hypothetical protein LC2W_3127 [Lacticaseibacillus paracasei]|nr:hypothetical protein LC2W_3127 [Lacticaseibacillus paracasei]AEA58634.1 hypothetical protein LCBD_3145 [Lacticaseibacillus paracasei]